MRDALIDLLREAGIEVVTDNAEAQRELQGANDAIQLMAEKDNIDNGINALRLIAEGADTVPNAMRRNDLSKYGGDNSITFIYGETGDPKRNFKKGYGIAHIGGKHGADTLLHVLQVIASGKIDRYVPGNKTVILSDGEYEVVLGLTRFGNKETWLFNGWKKEEKTGADGEVSTQSDATQANPTFSRADLGAVLSDAKLQSIFGTTSGNAEKIDFHRVWHGSRADFDAFDHSHMGEGEGLQAYGWGTYVTELENIGRRYAEYTRQRDSEIIVNDIPLREFLSNNGYDRVFLMNISGWERTIDELKSHILNCYIDGRVASAKSERTKKFKKQKQELLKLIDNGVINLDMDPRFLYEVKIPDNDGTKVLQNLEKLAKEAENKSNRPRTF